MTPPPLWRHQTQAVSFVQQLWDQGHRGALLALVMGSGKTRVSIELAKRNAFQLLLILCPLRVVEVWREQFERYAPEYGFLTLDDRIGTVADKAMVARDRMAWSTAKGQPLALAINYESARLEPFAHWALANLWPLVICDESHRLKENSGSTSRFCGRLAVRARYRLGLTGTPMPHSPLDVWAQFRFLDRSVYDETFSSFRQRYAIMGGFQNREVKQWRDLEELRTKFFSRAFQVGAEVLDLPGEQDQSLYCTLGEKGRRMYTEMERDLLTWIEEGRMVTAANALVRLLRLEQITSGVVTDTDGEERIVDEGKRRLLEDLFEDLPADEPVVVFARFRADLAAVHWAAAQTGRASGELSGSHDDLAAWKRSGPHDPVILAVQIQSGGVGIDLTRARIAVYYSLGFNLADYLQSRARLYRAGQTRPVIFYRLTVRGTVDEIVERALAHRQDLIESVLQELRTTKPCHA